MDPTYLAVVGIVVTVVIGGIGIARMPKIRQSKTRTWNVLLCGLGGTGKSRLAWQWSRADVQEVFAGGATPIRKIYEIERRSMETDAVVYRRIYRLYDIGGQQPGELLDTVLSESFHALIAMVDHTRADTGPAPPDLGRMHEHIGYVQGIVQGFLQSEKLSKDCKAAILFINKSDLVSPADEESVETALQDIIKMFEEQPIITPHVFRGSARDGLNTKEALVALDRALLQ